MKRFMTVTLIGAMTAMLLVGCGDKSAKTNETADTTPAAAAAETVPAVETTAVTPETTVSEENVLEYGYMEYSDMISFAVEGFQDGWQTINAADMGLSTMLHYNSVNAGFIQTDIDGDGIKELIIGENTEGYPTICYDIYTINPEDGSLVEINPATEEDLFFITDDGLVAEEVYDSEGNCSYRTYTIAYNEFALVDEICDPESYVTLELDYFSNYVD